MQQKLADYKQPAPDLSWSELETALASNKKTALIPMWTKRVAAAAVVLLIVGLGWRLSQTDNHTKEQQKTASTTISEIKASTEETATQEESQPVATEQSVDEGGVPLKPQIKPQKLIARVENMTEDHGENTAESEADTENADVARAIDSHDEAQSTPQDHQTEGRQDEVINDKPHSIERHVADLSNLQRRAVQKNRLTAKVYYSNSFSDFKSMNSIPQVGMYAEADAFYINLNDSSMTSGGEMAGAAGSSDMSHRQKTVPHPKYAPHSSVVQEYAEHHLPIRLGLSFRYQLTQKWSVETGLTYTYLSSDIKRKVAANPFLFQIEQKLHYVGIPVNAEYLLLENKHFNVYASAGTMVEKMVRGRRNDEYNGQSEKVSIHPLQFSLNCAAGAEWKMNRLLSIYAEPGLTYHFDNHSQVPTYYQDKPLGFNLNLGVRIDFKR